jgi:hypothetical protein
MADEVIITETPPFYNGYGRCGQSVMVPITGNRAKRILHGAINIRSGDVALEESQRLAASLDIEIRFLPRATPELNVSQARLFNQSMLAQTTSVNCA